MIVVKEFPGKTFNSENELFKYLMANKTILIEAKKAEIYKSIDKGLKVLTSQKSILKIADTSKAFKMNENYYYFVVNSANILDTHADMHIEGNWEKTVKEQQGKVYLVWDHELKRSEIIVMKSDVEMFTSKIPWSLLGKDYEGETYCLVYKVLKTKVVNKEAKEWLENDYDFEASVRMQYMDIDIAIDSKDNDMVKEKANFDLYYPIIANKSDFEKINYFWIIKQAKNVMESSLVMFGSNSATGRLQENNEPEKSTLENKEPTEVTQSEQEIVFNPLIFM